MNSVQPFVQTQGSSGGALVSLSLGFLVLMYMMYDHFEKRLRMQIDLNQETEARFRVTEDRLATLNELEDDVKTLAEAEEERKSSWEDDITEPGKYQAILGVGSVNGSVDVELRLIYEKLNTFKSNRYWLLNNDINYDVIQYIIDKNMVSKYFREKNEKLVSSFGHIIGLDGMLRIECILPKRWNPPYEQDIHLLQTIAGIRKEEFKWKRVLVDA